MLFRLLDLLGRKRVVLDRGPSHPQYRKAKPWLARYYLLFRKRPRWFPFNIIVHEMLDNDHGDGVHNHQCPYLTITLKGGYWETTENGTFWRGPGYIGFRKASDRHSLKIQEGKSAWTLLFVGPNKGSKQFAKYSK